MHHLWFAPCPISVIIICILFPEWLTPCYCSLEVITTRQLGRHRNTYIGTMNSPSKSVKNTAQVPFSVSGWIFQFRIQYFKGIKYEPWVPGLLCFFLSMQKNWTLTFFFKPTPSQLSFKPCNQMISL